jgi:O-antigen/teichoic acid export membrane protein
VWSLVIQRYVIAIATTGVAWWSFRWKPGRAFSWTVLRGQMGLGGSVALSDVLLIVLARSQDLIITRVLGLHATGVYRVSWKTIEVISQGLIIPISSVSTPALAKLRHDMGAFERGYLNIVGATAVLAMPAIVGVGVLSDQIIPLLYGAKWHEAVAPALILTLMAVPFLLNNFATPALLVLRKPKAIAKLSVAQLGGTLLFCILAAPFGLVAIAGAYVARAYLTMAYQLWLGQQATGIRAMRVLKTVMPSLVASTAMAVVLLLTTRYVLPMQSDPSTEQRIVRLVVSVVGGGVVYLVLGAILYGPVRRRQLITMATQMIRRSGAPVDPVAP